MGKIKNISGTPITRSDVKNMIYQDLVRRGLLEDGVRPRLRLSTNANTLMCHIAFRFINKLSRDTLQLCKGLRNSPKLCEKDLTGALSIGDCGKLLRESDTDVRKRFVDPRHICNTPTVKAKRAKRAERAAAKKVGTA